MFSNDTCKEGKQDILLLKNRLARALVLDSSHIYICNITGRFRKVVPRAFRRARLPDGGVPEGSLET